MFLSIQKKSQVTSTHTIKCQEDMVEEEEVVDVEEEEVVGCVEEEVCVAEEEEEVEEGDGVGEGLEVAVGGVEEIGLVKGMVLEVGDGMDHGLTCMIITMELLGHLMPIMITILQQQRS